jgi:hypothetical protein
MDKVVMCAESGIWKYIFILFGLFSIPIFIFPLFILEIRQNFIMLVILIFSIIVSICAVVFAHLADIIIFENGFKVKHLKYSEMIKFDDIKTIKGLGINLTDATAFITKKNKFYTAHFGLFSNGNEMLKYILKRIEESSIS